ncbi:MAG: DUF3450 family protein [Phycisphaera sp.]|nr:DUF3450 family protein [Phycisphaera sp.]
MPELPRNLRLFRAAASIAAVATLAAIPAFADDTPVSERIGGMRDAFDRWVETRRVISEETRDWTLGKDMLDSRLDILRRELAAVREKIAESERSTTDADRRTAELAAQRDALRAASAELASTAAALETRTKALVARLPDPIRDRIKPLSQRLPADPAASELPLSTRFQNVVGLVNEVNKFNREITVTSEIRALPDGTSAEVTVVYLGLAQAYYTGGNGRIAGFGAATADGWTWTPANEAAPQVARLVAILKNESPAEFVLLPLGAAAAKSN